MHRQFMGSCDAQSRCHRPWAVLVTRTGLGDSYLPQLCNPLVGVRPQPQDACKVFVSHLLHGKPSRYRKKLITAGHGRVLSLLMTPSKLC
jgi:hypothetical protein